MELVRCQRGGFRALRVVGTLIAISVPWHSEEGEIYVQNRLIWVGGRRAMRLSHQLQLQLQPSALALAFYSPNTEGVLILTVHK